jgi:sugar lactone lactonase YvrE
MEFPDIKGPWTIFDNSVAIPGATFTLESGNVMYGTPPVASGTWIRDENSPGYRQDSASRITITVRFANLPKPLRDYIGSAYGNITLTTPPIGKAPTGYQWAFDMVNGYEIRGYINFGSVSISKPIILNCNKENANVKISPDTIGPFKFTNGKTILSIPSGNDIYVAWAIDISASPSILPTGDYTLRYLYTGTSSRYSISTSVVVWLPDQSDPTSFVILNDPNGILTGTNFGTSPGPDAIWRAPRDFLGEYIYNSGISTIRLNDITNGTRVDGVYNGDGVYYTLDPVDFTFTLDSTSGVLVTTDKSSGSVRNYIKNGDIIVSDSTNNIYIKSPLSSTAASHPNIDMTGPWSLDVTGTGFIYPVKLLGGDTGYFGDLSRVYSHLIDVTGPHNIGPSVTSFTPFSLQGGTGTYGIVMYGNPPAAAGKWSRSELVISSGGYEAIMNITFTETTGRFAQYITTYGNSTIILTLRGDFRTGKLSGKYTQIFQVGSSSDYIRFLNITIAPTTPPTLGLYYSAAYIIYIYDNRNGILDTTNFTYTISGPGKMDVLVPGSSVRKFSFTEDSIVDDASKTYTFNDFSVGKWAIITPSPGYIKNTDGTFYVDVVFNLINFVLLNGNTLNLKISLASQTTLNTQYDNKYVLGAVWPLFAGTIIRGTTAMKMSTHTCPSSPAFLPTNLYQYNSPGKLSSIFLKSDNTFIYIDETSTVYSGSYTMCGNTVTCTASSGTIISGIVFSSNTIIINNTYFKKSQMSSGPPVYYNVNASDDTNLLSLVVLGNNMWYASCTYDKSYSGIYATYLGIVHFYVTSDPYNMFSSQTPAFIYASGQVSKFPYIGGTYNDVPKLETLTCAAQTRTLYGKKFVDPMGNALTFDITNKTWSMASGYSGIFSTCGNYIFFTVTRDDNNVWKTIVPNSVYFSGNILSNGRVSINETINSSLADITGEWTVSINTVLQFKFTLDGGSGTAGDMLVAGSKVGTWTRQENTYPGYSISLRRVSVTVNLNITAHQYALGNRMTLTSTESEGTVASSPSVAGYNINGNINFGYKLKRSEFLLRKFNRIDTIINDGTIGPGKISYDDNGGVLYVTNTSSISMVSPRTQTVSTLSLTGLNGPTGITHDSNSNFYFCDTGNNMIKMFSSDGSTFTTLAGSGISGSDDTTVTAATFNQPKGIAIDSTTGNLYVTDSGNNKIRMITPAGVVTTLTLTGSVGTILNGPIGITFLNGELYFCDNGNNVIKKVTTGGVLSRVLTGVSSPNGITNDGTFLYFCETGNNVVKKLSTTGGVTTIASGLNRPRGITTDGTFLYFCDTGINAIKKVPKGGGTVTTIATGIVNPLGIVYLNNYLYITSTQTGGSIVVLFKQGTSWVLSPNITGIGNPLGITVDSAGKLYFTDTGTHSIKTVVGSTINAFAGTGSPGSVDTTFTAPTFNQPKGITIDPSSGNLYVTDSGNNKIRMITPAGVVTTIASGLTRPEAITFSGGNLYVSDTDGIKKIVLPAGTVSPFITNFKADDLTSDDIGNLYGLNIPLINTSQITPSEIIFNLMPLGHNPVSMCFNSSFDTMYILSSITFSSATYGLYKLTYDDTNGNIEKPYGYSQIVNIGGSLAAGGGSLAAGGGSLAAGGIVLSGDISGGPNPVPGLL